MKAGAGIDLVQVARLEAILAELGTSFLDRSFTPLEQATCGGSVARLAGRWAAKEAVMKVLGAGVDELALLDIEVGRGPSGMPTLTLHGDALQRARRQGWLDWSVSISHDGQYATAVAIATA